MENPKPSNTENVGNLSNLIYSISILPEKVYSTGRHAYFWDFYQSPDKRSVPIGTSRYVVIRNEKKQNIGRGPQSYNKRGRYPYKMVI